METRHLVLVAQGKLIEPVDVEDEVDPLSYRQQIGKLEQLLGLFARVLRQVYQDDISPSQCRQRLQRLAERRRSPLTNREVHCDGPAEDDCNEIIWTRGTRILKPFTLAKPNGVVGGRLEVRLKLPAKSKRRV